MFSCGVSRAQRLDAREQLVLLTGLAVTTSVAAGPVGFDIEAKQCHDSWPIVGVAGAEHAHQA